MPTSQTFLIFYADSYGKNNHLDYKQFCAWQNKDLGLLTEFKILTKTNYKAYGKSQGHSVNSYLIKALTFEKM